MGLIIGAWLDIRSKPFRTFAALIGMIVAIVAVVLVNAASTLSHTANAEYLARTFGQPVTFTLGSQNPSAIDSLDVNIESIFRGNGFGHISRITGFSLEILNNEHLSPTGGSMVVSSAYPDIRLVHLVYGSWPIEAANSRIAHGVVSSSQAQLLGFRNGNAIGQVIWFSIREDATGAQLKYANLQPMVIDGVFDPELSAAYSPPILIVSNLTHPPFLPEEMDPESWVVRVHPSDVNLFMSLANRFTLSDGTPLLYANRDDRSADLAPTLDQQHITAQIVSIVAFGIGGFGVLGVGLASVRERSHDFGLHRALGASRPQIFFGRGHSVTH